jgi:hypothetical protein
LDRQLFSLAGSAETVQKQKFFRQIFAIGEHFGNVWNNLALSLPPCGIQNVENGHNIINWVQRLNYIGRDVKNCGENTIAIYKTTLQIQCGKYYDFLSHQIFLPKVLF